MQLTLLQRERTDVQNEVVYIKNPISTHNKPHPKLTLALNIELPIKEVSSQ